MELRPETHHHRSGGLEVLHQVLQCLHDLLGAEVLARDGELAIGLPFADAQVQLGEHDAALFGFIQRGKHLVAGVELGVILAGPGHRLRERQGVWLCGVRASACVQCRNGEVGFGFNVVGLREHQQLAAFGTNLEGGAVVAAVAWLHAVQGVAQRVGAGQCFDGHGALALHGG